MNRFRKKFVISIVLILCLNLLVILALFFLLGKIDSTKNEVLDTKKNILSYEKRLLNAQKTEGVLLDTKYSRSKIESTFVSKNSLVDFIKELEYLAETTNVSLETKKVVLEEGEKQIPYFTLFVKGAFLDVYRFLLLLENDKYQVGFDKFSFQKPDEENSWSVNLEIKILSFLTDL